MNWYKRQLKIAGGPRRNWTEDDIQAIKELVEEGNSFRQIASLVGTSHNMISALNKKYKWRDLEKEISERDKFITDLYLLPPLGQGLSGWKIQNGYGVGDKTIKNILRRNGLFDHYRGLDESHEVQRQRYVDNPELREQVSDRVKQIHKDNPEIARQTSIRQKKKFEDPALREEYSRMGKQRYIDNPEMAENYSKYKKDWWDNYPGGYEAWLSTFPPEKQIKIRDAIQAGNHL